ncbi:hypothetical protein LCGC14_1012380, partial [marine sediment metagenome]
FQTVDLPFGLSLVPSFIAALIPLG